MLILKLVKLVINSCVKLNVNRSINVGASGENVFFFFFFFFFLKIATVIDLNFREHKLELVQDIIILHICVK